MESEFPLLGAFPEEDLKLNKYKFISTQCHERQNWQIKSREHQVLLWRWISTAFGSKSLKFLKINLRDI